MQKILAHLLILILFIPGVIHASLDISEVMYDPKGANTNHQWVEVYNSGSDSVSIDATKWRFNDGSSHYMNSKTSFSVPANSYFILTGDKNTFLSDYPGFGGVVIDTSMSLDKDGGTVSILNDGSTVSLFSYDSSMGGAEDGNSLQKSGSIWIADIPTPGMPYTETIVNNTNNEEQAVEAANLKSSSDVESASPKVYKISTDILSKSVVIAGVDFMLRQQTTGLQKEIVQNGKLVWSFGDGMSLETSNLSTPFPYRYDYPGEYLVTLSYYKDNFTNEPDAIDRLSIKVISPSIFISAVGTISDPYIEIENKSSYEINLSDWKIDGGVKSFIFSKGTTILPGKRIKMPSRITGFRFEDLSNIKIFSPAGEVFATYPASVTKSDSVNINKISTQTKSSNTNLNTNNKNKYSKVINLDDMSANASDSKKGDISTNTILLIILGVLLVGGTLYVINNKEEFFNSKDSLEKKIRPEDIDILG